MDLQQKAAQLLEESGQIDAAAELWMAAGKWDAISRMVMLHGQALLEQGRISSLASWLHRLPENMFNSNPWMLLFGSYCKLPFQPHRAKALAEKAYNGFKANGDREGKLLACSAAIDCIEFSMSGYVDMDEWIHVFEQVKREYEALPIDAIKTKVASCIFAALAFRQPGHPYILDLADQAIKMADEICAALASKKIPKIACTCPPTSTLHPSSALKRGHLDWIFLLPSASAVVSGRKMA